VKLVYICSPYAGDIESNIRFAKDACRYAMEQDCAPVAVHLLYPLLLNDAIPSERETGIRMGLRVLASCEELWICGGHISSASVCGSAEAWLKQDGEPVTFDTYGEAATEAKRLMQDIRTPNVSYFPKEREIELEEAPSPGMKLQL
jgi:hypothetical protein